MTRWLIGTLAIIASATPGDDRDGNWSDFSQVPLALLLPAALFTIVAGSVLFYLVRRQRRGGGGGDR